MGFQELSPPTLARKTRLWIAFGFLLLAAVPRFWALGELGFYGDEETTAFPARAVALGGPPEMPSGMPYYRSYPFTLANALSAKLFGVDRELSYRVPAALFGTLTVPIFFLLACGRYRWDVAILAAGWLAMSEWHIAVSREARMYAPFLLFFLLTVAIVDDIGAVIVIAVFYTANIDLTWLVGSLVVFSGMVAMNKMGVARMWPFVLAAVALWFCVLNSGVHATIAGVVAALTIPMRKKDGHSMLEEMEHGLVGWNAYIVVPVFGFANAGVNLSGLGLGALLDPLPLAVGTGLVVGKQVGIFGCVFAADKLGIARKPASASWAEVWGVSILCGIGFTMSLFIGELAFPGYRLLIEEAKIGILSGSLISAILGYTVLRLTTTHPEEKDDPSDPIV